MSDKNIPSAEKKVLDGLVSVLNTEKFNKLLDGYICSKKYFEIPRRKDLETECDCKLNVADCKSWLIVSFLEAFKKKSGTVEMYKDKSLNYDELQPYLDKKEFSKGEIKELNKVLFGIDSIQQVIKLFINALTDNKKRVKKFDEESFNILFKSVSENDKDEKIPPCLSACFFRCFDRLDVNQIQLIREKTNIEASSELKIDGNFISNVIRKLGKEEVASEQLLKFLFDVYDLSFENRLDFLYDTVTNLILHSKEYIDGNVGEAVRKVFSNSSPYEKLYEALCEIGKKCPNLFNMETIAGTGGRNLAKMLLANNLFINFKDNGIQVSERDELGIDGLVSLLSYSSPKLSDMVKSAFKKVDKLKNAKSLCLKIGMNSDFDDDMKQIYNELNDLDKDVVYEKLNTVKLRFRDAIELISRIQIVPESLEEKDFNDFKIAIENFSKCWAPKKNDTKLRLWELLMFFKEGSLTGEQILGLLDLTTKARIVENELYASCVEIDWILSRLKSGESASKRLLEYFCRGFGESAEKAKYWFVNANEVCFSSVYEWGEEEIHKMQDSRIINNYFWSAIYRLIVHSEEYIKRDDEGEKAIKNVLEGKGNYAWFKHLIKESLNYEHSYEHGYKPDGALTRLYNYEYHEGDENSPAIKAFDELLKANNLKICLNGESEYGDRRIELEAVDKNKDENKNVEVKKEEEKKGDSSEKVKNENVNENKNEKENNSNENPENNSGNKEKATEINNGKPIKAATEEKTKIEEENQKEVINDSNNKNNENPTLFFYKPDKNMDEQTEKNKGVEEEKQRKGDNSEKVKNKDVNENKKKGNDNPNGNPKNSGGNQEGKPEKIKDEKSKEEGNDSNNGNTGEKISNQYETVISNTNLQTIKKEKKPTKPTFKDKNEEGNINQNLGEEKEAKRAIKATGLEIIKKKTKSKNKLKIRVTS